MLQEWQLDLNAVLVAVGEDVLLERGLRERVVKILVDRRNPEGRLPIVARQGEGRALSMVIRSEDDEGRGPAVRRESRVTVRRDRAGVNVARMGDHEADQSSRSASKFRRPTRSERMGVALPDLAEKGISRALVESSRHRRIPHGRAPSEGRLIIINGERKLFVGLHGAAGLQDLAGQEPVHGREGATALVVRRHDEIHIPRLVVCVTQGDDRDADIQRLAERLLIRRRVGDDEDLRLHELREIRVCEGARNESAGEDLRPDVLREEARGLLAVLTGRDPEDVLRLEPREELRRLPNPGVGLLDVQDVEAVGPDFVDERLHVGAFLLRADVHARRQVDILGDEQSLHARLLFFLHHAPAWSCSSIRMSSLSFAIRSPPTAPVLMPRHPNATARWAIVSSVVSPDRCDITVANPDLWARSTAARVSESVPIWFGLIRIALPARSSIPRRNRSTSVTKMSSPMTLHRPPIRRVRSANAPKSSWSNGSSTLNSP